MRRLLGLVAGLALLLGPVFATVYAALTLEAQVEKAEVIVHATVRSVVVEDRAGKPWTVYGLTPRRFLRGGAGDLPASGGGPSIAVLGGRNLRLEGAPAFREGEEVVLLLYVKPYDSPVVGFRQGAYRVATGNRITDLDNRVVSVPAEGRTVEASLESFLRRLEALAGGR